MSVFNLPKAKHAFLLNDAEAKEEVFKEATQMRAISSVVAATAGVASVACLVAMLANPILGAIGAVFFAAVCILARDASIISDNIAALASNPDNVATIAVALIKNFFLNDVLKNTWIAHRSIARNFIDNRFALTW